VSIFEGGRVGLIRHCRDLL